MSESQVVVLSGCCFKLNATGKLCVVVCKNILLSGGRFVVIRAGVISVIDRWESTWMAWDKTRSL